MKAVIYARFSPRPGAEHCDSNDRQIHDCRVYCDQQKYQVVKVYADQAISGGRKKGSTEIERLGLGQALLAHKRGYILVATCHDRLARDMLLAETIKARAEKRGARVETVDGIWKVDETPDQAFARQVLGAAAERERKVTAIMTQAAMLAKQANGQRMSDRTPYGWHRDPNDPARLVAIAEEQENIAKILEASNQGHGLREIARALQAAQTRCRGGRKWHHHTIARILRRAKRVKAASIASARPGSPSSP